MNPTEPTPEGAPAPEEQSSSFELTYRDVSQVSREQEKTRVSLFADAGRPNVRLEGRLRDPIRFREALSALFAVVGSDYRYKPRDKTQYAAYIRMKKETSALNVWQAQQAYFTWLQRNDPMAAMILDPIITVHPDGLHFEVFSKDESTYAQLSVDASSLDIQDTPIFGTTNIDFSQNLFDGLQLMRSYRDTVLNIGGDSVRVATSGAKPVLEKKIRVPDSWLRGFLQVQASSTLPKDIFSIAPLDLYNTLRYMRMHADIKGNVAVCESNSSPAKRLGWCWSRGNRCEMSGGHVQRQSARVLRIWGRRRLMLIQRLLPFIEDIQIHVLGSGLPSFWVMKCGGMTFTLGMTGFTAANWSQALNFDLLLPRKTQDEKPVGSVIDYLADGVYQAKGDDIAKGAGLKGSGLTEALVNGCQQGKIMFDLAANVYRLRPLTASPLKLEKLEYRNNFEKVAYDLMTRRGAVKVSSENRIPGSGLEVVGKVAVTEDKRDYRPQLLIGDEGQVLKAECTCAFFRQNGLRSGPCPHLIALRLAYAKIEAEKVKGIDPTETIQVQTRTYSRRDEAGVETVYQVSLERQKLRIRWGVTGVAPRLQTLRFNNVAEAREAYFAAWANSTKRDI